MTPIYFPYTWADVPTVQAVTSVFPKIVMYQPSVCKGPSLLQPFEQAGALEIRVPVTKDSDKLASLVSEYRNWARLHQGSDLAYFKARQPAAPFMENLSSSIRSDILKYQEDPSSEPMHDPAFNARLFLEIAAAYDAEQAELSCDFSEIQNLEKRFMAALGDHTEIAETAPLGSLSLFQDDSGDYMLAERLQAWSRLMLEDKGQQAAGIWVTSRLSVIEWIQGQIDMEPILEINCIPVLKNSDDNTRFWQESIMSYLSRLQSNPWPSAIKPFEPPSSDYAWENAVSAKGFIIANLPPEALLQKMAADTSARRPDSGKIRHTLVVCVSAIRTA